jgi:hypothetical protein
MLARSLQTPKGEIMADFEYGPVDLYLVGFEGDRPGPGVLEAIGELIEGGEIRLLDFLVISRHDDGAVFVTEFADVSDEYGFGTVELEAVGLVADEDAKEAPRLEVRRVGRHRAADRTHTRAGRQRRNG